MLAPTGRRHLTVGCYATCVWSRGTRVAEKLFHSIAADVLRAEGQRVSGPLAFHFAAVRSQVFGKSSTRYLIGEIPRVVEAS